MGRDLAAAKIWAEAIESESIRSMLVSQINQQWTEQNEAEYREILGQ